MSLLSETFITKGETKMSSKYQTQVQWASFNPRASLWDPVNPVSHMRKLRFDNLPSCTERTGTGASQGHCHQNLLLFLLQLAASKKDILDHSRSHLIWLLGQQAPNHWGCLLIPGLLSRSWRASSPSHQVVLMSHCVTQQVSALGAPISSFPKIWVGLDQWFSHLLMSGQLYTLKNSWRHNKVLFM